MHLRHWIPIEKLSFKELFVYNNHPCLMIQFITITLKKQETKFNLCTNENFVVQFVTTARAMITNYIGRICEDEEDVEDEEEEEDDED